MKKIKYLLFLLIFMPFMVGATNHIYSIDVDAYINEDGSANIKETWKVDGSDGTEWYKAMYDLENMELTNFKVSMDGKDLTYKNWNIDESLEDKKGYYGINYSSDGPELCFGKYDFNSHTFVLTYDLSNFVFNTNDSQAVYYNFIDKLSNVDFDNYSVNITSYYSFPDTLDVWGYGYKGYAYVKDGKISMSNEDNMDGNYVVLLAKFPLNTFKTDNTTQYESFNDIYTKAEDGTFDYNYDNNDYENMSLFERIFSWIIGLGGTFFPVIIIALMIKAFAGTKYGYVDNKTITKDNTPMFRDIPCKKDIYYANALINLNNFGYKETNILGAIILKWVKNKKIEFKNEKNGIFNKDTSVLDLTHSPVFDNEFETELFGMMYKASNDGLLESKELEKWCRNNYSKFFNLFQKIKNKEIDKLKDGNHIFKRTDKKQCKYSNVMDDTIYEDSKQLYGLKLYLKEFSRMDKKEVMEVHIWDEYLMFAYLFGIADKVAKQLQNLYPEVLKEYNYDYNTIIFVNNLSYRSVSAASSARSAAQSYSSGGGGFSSGGGGGGSFGGGGGGSR